MAGIETTLAGSKFYVCAAPQSLPISQAAFEALTWVEVANVGNVGDFGTDENVVSYPTLGTTTQKKSKGIGNAGDPEIEVARIYDDPGQIIMRAAAATRLTYAFKHELADSPNGILPNTKIYTAGIVTGPRRPGGGNEDFVREVYALGLTQREIVVNPS